jgi:uncharacterized membrane protein YesL
MDMNRDRLYSNILAIALILAIIILGVGLIVSAPQPSISKCIINIGILLLYATPLFAVLSLLSYSLYKRDYITSILILILIALVTSNVIYLGLPPIC